MDTGSEVIALFERAAARHVGVEANKKVEADTLAGSVMLSWFTSRQLRIGGLLLRQRPVVVTSAGDQELGYDGILGIGSVTSRVQLDLKRMVISW